MKILNLYAGIGGNRKLWGTEHKVTAIENNPKIAKIYKGFFPNDIVICANAHMFLLKHFEEFDFIWSSPPCPTHSKVRKANPNQNKPVFPDMKLYEEILLLKHYFKGMWVVENVVSFYKPLIKPFECGKHYYWSNFVITELSLLEKHDRGMGREENLQDLYKLKGFDLSNFDGIDKMKTIRNCVEPKAALHIFKCAFKDKQSLLL